MVFTHPERFRIASLSARKKLENQWFGLPKPSPDPPKPWTIDLGGAQDAQKPIKNENKRSKNAKCGQKVPKRCPRAKNSANMALTWPNNF